MEGMEGLFSRDVVFDVRSGPGVRAKQPAKMAVCYCGHEQFACFVVVRHGARHVHFQCASCDAIYCDGACSRGVDPDELAKSWRMPGEDERD